MRIALRSFPVFRPVRSRVRRAAQPEIKGPRVPRHSGGSGQPAGGSFKAGDPVPQSGIYEVVHARAHRATHEVVMLSGDQFPPCDSCDENVRFRLVRTAPYIFQDEDFEESD